MDDEYVPFKFTFPSPPAPAKEDDCRLDKGIQQEEDAHMKMQSQSRLREYGAELAAALRASSSIRGEDFTTVMRLQQSQSAALAEEIKGFSTRGGEAPRPQQSQSSAIFKDFFSPRGEGEALTTAKSGSIRGKGRGLTRAILRPQQSADLAAAIKDSSINQRGKGEEDDYVPVRFFNFTLPDSIITPPKEDDSWLDKEIEQEQDARMKDTMIRVKRTMDLLDNETKRDFIFEERMRIVEREQYANDINSTQGFEVGEYPYLSRQLYGSFITRYYCPPETTITDYELDKLTSFANMAIGRYNITHNAEFGNVLVIKAMRSSSSGHCYYLTFQASLPDHTPQMFETQLYDAPHWVSPPVTIDFVRRKMHHPN